MLISSEKLCPTNLAGFLEAWVKVAGVQSSLSSLARVASACWLRVA